MAYGHLLSELSSLRELAIKHDVHHIGRQPMTPAMLSRRGLSASAAHPRLAAKMGGKPSRKVADRMADEPFRWGSACNPGRYSKGFPALYTANDFDTAVAEVEYHLVKRGAVANGLRPRYVILTAHVAGPGKDLFKLPDACQPALIFDTDYRPTQALGTAAKATPLVALQVPSARRMTGINFPVFAREAIQPTEANRKIVFFMTKAGKFTWTISQRARPAKKKKR